MKILVTGAGGFLGWGLVRALEESGRHELRLMDVVDFDEPNHEKLVGSVADLETCERAVEGCDALLIAHMARRDTKSYDTPTGAFDVNARGTANLFWAAARRDIRRVCIVSSAGVICREPQGAPRPFWHADLPLGSNGMYGLTKIIQEIIGEQFHRCEGFQVACLRVGYILDADAMQDKYGQKIGERNWQNTDRRDIGTAALAALELEDLGFEPFYIMGTDEAMAWADVGHARDRLGWMPRYKFKELPPSQVLKDRFGPEYT